MISWNLRISLIIGVILYFIIVGYFLKSKKLLLKYMLSWLVLGVAMALLIAFPGMLEWITGLLGIVTPMYGLFIICIFFILVIMISLTAIISRQSERMRSLSQYTAMLEERIRKIEEGKNDENRD